LIYRTHFDTITFRLKGVVEMKKRIVLLMGVLVCSGISRAMVITDTYEYDIRLENSDFLLVTGGGADQVTAFDNSSIEIRGTARPLQIDVGGIWNMTLFHNSTLSYYGGETGGITFYSNASAVLQGGRIDYISSYQYVPMPNNTAYPHIEIISREYDDSNPNLITGIWNVDNDSDGEFDTFSINLIDQTGYDHVIDNITFTIIPEPATLCMVAVGVLLVRRRSERRRHLPPA